MNRRLNGSSNNRISTWVLDDHLVRLEVPDHLDQGLEVLEVRLEGLATPGRIMARGTGLAILDLGVIAQVRSIMIFLLLLIPLIFRFGMEYVGRTDQLFQVRTRAGIIL